MTVKNFLKKMNIGVSDISRVEIWERLHIVGTVYDYEIKKQEYGEYANRTINSWGIIGKRIDIHLKPIE